MRGETPSIALSLRWQDAGPRGSDYECGAWFNGSATFEGQEQRANFAWRCMLVARAGALELGVGPAYLQNTDAFNSSHTNFALLARYRLGKRWYLTLDEHASNGGSRPKNRGRDMARIGFVAVF